MMKAIVHQPMLAAAMLGAVALAAIMLPHGAASGQDEDAVAGGEAMAQQSTADTGELITPSMVYRIAVQYVPGCTVLRVSLDHASKTYAVKLKSGNEVRKLYVDARTGQVVGD
jgi:uncharacterized membrane protein YkoI